MLAFNLHFVLFQLFCPLLFFRFLECRNWFPLRVQFYGFPKHWTRWLYLHTAFVVWYNYSFIRAIGSIIHCFSCPEKRDQNWMIISTILFLIFGPTFILTHGQWLFVLPEISLDYHSCLLWSIKAFEVTFAWKKTIIRLFSLFPEEKTWEFTLLSMQFPVIFEYFSRYWFFLSNLIIILSSFVDIFER